MFDEDHYNHSYCRGFRIPRVDTHFDRGCVRALEISLIRGAIAMECVPSAKVQGVTSLERVRTFFGIHSLKITLPWDDPSWIDPVKIENTFPIEGEPPSHIEIMDSIHLVFLIQELYHPCAPLARVHVEDDHHYPNLSCTFHHITPFRPSGQCD